MNLRDRFRPFYAPDPGGAAPPAAAPAPGAPGNPAPGAAAAPGADPGGGQAPGGAASAPYRPEGLPDHLFAQNDKGTIDNLWKAAQGYRQRDSERGAIPEKPDGYAYQPSEKLTPYAKAFEGDGFFKAIKEDALAAGLGDKQFGGFINRVLERMIDGQMLEPPYDEAAERAAMLPAAMQNLPPEQQKTEIDKITRDNIAFVEAMKARGLNADAATSFISELGDRGHFNVVLSFLRGQIGAGVQPGGGGQPGGQLTQSQLADRQADPRNKPGNQKYDRAFHEETIRLYQQNIGQ